MATKEKDEAIVKGDACGEVEPEQPRIFKNKKMEKAIDDLFSDKVIEFDEWKKEFDEANQEE